MLSDAVSTVACVLSEWAFMLYQQPLFVWTSLWNWRQISVTATSSNRPSTRPAFATPSTMSTWENFQRRDVTRTSRVMTLSSETSKDAESREAWGLSSTARPSDTSTPQPVWLELANFRHFGKTLKDFGNILKFYLEYGILLNLLWQIWSAIWKIVFAVNGEILKNNLAIWSHWPHLLLNSVKSKYTYLV